MKINYFNVTFWFNICDNHLEVLEKFRKEFKDEYENFNIKNNTNNLLEPIIMAINEKNNSKLIMSQINFQFIKDNTNIKEIKEFKEHLLKIFETLNSSKIEILHTSIFVNGEVCIDNALDKIIKNTINKNLINENIIDVTLKFGKKEEDLFYKIITLINKKQIKIPRKIDEKGRTIPIPLISWNGNLVENEMIDISYEINDKYSFDFTKNYHTTDFYLNKMLYILINNFENDIENLLEKGEF